MITGINIDPTAVHFLSLSDFFYKVSMCNDKA